jgi:tellurite resistance protein TerC
MELLADHSTRDWTVFGVLLAILLVVDLFSHRDDQHETQKNAVIWSVIWIGFGLVFTVYVWWSYGAAYTGAEGQLSGALAAQEYLAAYLIEKTLSVDNLFVFLLIFGSLRIPKENQRRVLSWGIFGALVFRGIFIYLGVEALEEWAWVKYVLAAILAVGAIRAFFEDPHADHEESKLVSWLSNHIPVTHKLHGHAFIAKEGGKWVATPLCVALIAIELTDVLFAVDSVPAALSVSHDIYIVYASNAFAILGLRSLYIAMSHILDDLEYLHYGLAAVLLFAAFKIGAHEWVPVSAGVSIGVIVVLIGGSIAASVWMPSERAKAASEDE